MSEKHPLEDEISAAIAATFQGGEWNDAARSILERVPLIAAAPKLLAVCEQFLETSDNVKYLSDKVGRATYSELEDVIYEARNAFRTAIRAALGED